MATDPPFAMFVLDKDITNEYINESLKRAFVGDFESNWWIWVATDCYRDIPPPGEVHKTHLPATKPPLPAGYSSPWVGKTVEDCAA
ncbi:hypothetical protein BDV95DRAFT_605828 [Massariosphaeria phaeospora]|uniref:Uncharacterized protein n=1 Tax=Massariosphaeria phaeospora TaxID=100035 RepID=A0A7C8MRJ5_9PLEO|nr:hypothetical protein BDV95DRAFT_605828 [Massariosphaeria phaeospora]